MTGSQKALKVISVIVIILAVLCVLAGVALPMSKPTSRTWRARTARRSPPAPRSCW